MRIRNFDANFIYNLFIISYKFVNLFSFTFISFILEDLYVLHSSMKQTLIEKLRCLLQLCFKSSRVSEWLEDEERKQGATVDLNMTNHSQFVDMRKRLTNCFNIDYKEDRRLRETEHGKIFRQ